MSKPNQKVTINPSLAGDAKIIECIKKLDMLEKRIKSDDVRVRDKAHVDIYKWAVNAHIADTVKTSEERIQAIKNMIGNYVATAETPEEKMQRMIAEDTDEERIKALFQKAQDDADVKASKKNSRLKSLTGSNKTKDWSKEPCTFNPKTDSKELERFIVSMIYAKGVSRELKDKAQIPKPKFLLSALGKKYGSAMPVVEWLKESGHMVEEHPYNNGVYVWKFPEIAVKYAAWKQEK